MSKEQCPDCEYDPKCFNLLKARNFMSKEPCGNFRKKREPKVKVDAHAVADNTVA